MSSTAAKVRYGPGVGIAAVIAGLLWLLVFHAGPPRAGTITAQGTVVDQDITRKGLCAPVAELNVNGTRYAVKSGTSAEPCAYRIGDPLEISYHPDDVAGTLEVPAAGASPGSALLAAVPGVLLLTGGATSLALRVARTRKAARPGALSPA
ncbi:DUF3592 domain-containing protein [Arthrobacter sp. PsM3]|uniref:DUF3592 domain-containing protein n=1 Tax=Arthrobacter sp. PsM3 TaxID=3030531 RepID=UPI00263AE874|nr:DUF3592 domain-containing protein [Arthrobacter sp. PsM3]MDN4645539.1 hypothetical protein [Arthrobacter sp. PsM3]